MKRSISEPNPLAAASAARRSDALIATAWGTAEATFFFLVPDVWLTRLALRGPGLSLALPFAGGVIGALAGGMMLYVLAASGAAAGLLRIMDYIPGIDPTLIERAGIDLQRSGWVALFQGALGGTPYKLYAVQAGSGAMPPAVFLATSAAARGTRFALTVAVTLLFKHVFLRHVPRATVVRLHGIVWTAFYIYYFAMFGL